MVEIVAAFTMLESPLMVCRFDPYMVLKAPVVVETHRKCAITLLS